MAKKDPARYYFNKLIKTTRSKPKKTHFKLKCLKCGYIWNTKYDKIPARCPSCNNMIYGTNNYETLRSPSTSSCFIATAAFGTPFAEEINILREWRDSILLRFLLGKVFVKCYYTISPPIAEYLSQRSILKAIVRKVLKTYVKFLKYKVY